MGGQLDPAQLAERVLAGERAALARAITLVESAAPKHQQPARDLLKRLLPHSGRSLRIGVTGLPGAGKSTFIDCLGSALDERGRRVAVLAVDPSSSLSGGSILGDKTRMERLSRSDSAFIRPTPSSGLLGGLAHKTREAVIVCEAAGYDIIIIETVGTGQSEAALRSVVDCLLLLLISGAGDDLQGIKKGLIELADALIINKADGDNIRAAQATRAQFSRSLRFLAPATPGWQTRAYAVSSLSGEGMAEIWRMIEAFTAKSKTSGIFARRRAAQRREWLHEALRARLDELVAGHPALKAALPEIEAAVVSGDMPASDGADELLRILVRGLHLGF